MIGDNEIVLLLDSDIFISDDFINFINLPLQDDTLYSFKRYDYYTYNNFVQDKYDNIYSIDFMGFFQLYKHNNKYYYRDSKNCRECDANFAKLFKKKILLNGNIIKHLGKDNVNHFGLIK
jgi:hypothetical protein